VASSLSPRRSVAHHRGNDSGARWLRDASCGAPAHVQAWLSDLRPAAWTLRTRVRRTIRLGRGDRRRQRGYRPTARLPGGRMVLTGGPWQRERSLTRGPLQILFHNKIKLLETELTARKIARVGKNSQKICGGGRYNLEQLL
jgi:hypothetical protein